MAQSIKETNGGKELSDSRGPIELQMSSPFLVLIDPLVLDGISAELQKLSPSEVAAIPNDQIPVRPDEVGLHPIEGFVEGELHPKLMTLNHR